MVNDVPSLKVWPLQKLGAPLAGSSKRAQGESQGFRFLQKINLINGFFCVYIQY
jgi:hypothetical protein